MSAMENWSATLAAGAILTALFSAISVRMVRRIAVKRALFDLPNTRSSHLAPVPRLGGAAFIPVVGLGVLVLGFSGGVVTPPALAAFFGGLALFTVSLVDDFRSLSTAVRFAVQFMAAGAFVLVAARNEPRVLQFPWVCGWLAGALLVVWIVGLLNIYNFMDGIDGIAGIQAVVAGIAWHRIGVMLEAPWAAATGACVAAGAAGFLTLNWAPAKIFMGDAGSTVLGFIFATLPMLVWRETQGVAQLHKLLAAAVLIVWPFVADGTFTLLRRAARGENVLQAHRSHLYQRLVQAGRSHAFVSTVYGLVATGGAGAALGALDQGGTRWIGAAGYGLLAFIVLWIWTVCAEGQQARDETAGK